jgi:hypothetical protein
MNSQISVRSSIARGCLQTTGIQASPLGWKISRTALGFCVRTNAYVTE